MRAATGDNGRAYARQTGDWTTLTADDASANIFLGGTWETFGPTNDAGTIKPSKLWLGKADTEPQAFRKMDGDAAHYDYINTQYPFFAGFDGKALNGGNAWATLLVHYNEAAPTVPDAAVAFSAAASKKVFFAGAFKNATWPSTDATKVLFGNYPAADSQYLLVLDGGNGGFVDASVLSDGLVGALHVLCLHAVCELCCAVCWVDAAASRYPPPPPQLPSSVTPL